MSSHNLNRYLFDLKNTPGLQAELKNKSHTRLAEYSLSAAESQAVVDFDVVALWRMGAHPLLLVPFSRFAGIPAPEYYRRLRDAGARCTLRSGEF